MPFPEALAATAAGRLQGTSPLDQIAVDSQGQAVIAFEHARRQGRGSAQVHLVEYTEPVWLEIFNLEQTHGCFLAVATPQTPGRSRQSTATELAPRQSQYDLNVTGVIQSVSPAFSRMFGWTAEEVVGKSSLDFIHPDDHENGIICWIELLESPAGQVRLRQRIKTTSGDWLWCELTETNLLDDPEHACVRSELVDVSREMAAQAALQRRERLLDRLNQALPTGVLQLDAAGEVEVQNERWALLTGCSREVGVGPLLARLEEPDVVERAIADAMASGTDDDVAVTFDGTGTCRFGELHLRPLTEDGVIAGMLLTLDDVTALQSYQMELAEQARHDALTATLNRFGIEQLVAERLAVHQGGEGELTVLFLDLDRFKTINDVYGHVTGDQVLRSVAACIGGLLRPTDRLGRLGGDEFLVILGPDTPAETATVLADRIRDALPGLADGLEDGLEIGASIGVAEAAATDDFDSLLKRADIAMYRAKDKTRDTASLDDGQPKPNR